MWRSTFSERKSFTVKRREEFSEGGLARLQERQFSDETRAIQWTARLWELKSWQPSTLVHHNAATRNAAMHNAIFSHRTSYPFFTTSSLWCSSLFFSIARDTFLHRAHRLSAFASNFPFATVVYCTKQQEIYQESQRSDVATGNAGWPSQTQTQTQRCGALSPQPFLKSAPTGVVMPAISHRWKTEFWYVLDIVSLAV